MVLDQSPTNSQVILNQYYHVTCVILMQDMQDAPIYAQAGKGYLSLQPTALRERRIALPQMLNATLLFLDTLRGTKRRRKAALNI